MDPQFSRLNPMLDKIKDLYTKYSNPNFLLQFAAAGDCTNGTNIVNCLLRGNKIIVCGHGRSYANAQFLVANLLHRYELERPSFPLSY